MGGVEFDLVSQYPQVSTQRSPDNITSSQAACMPACPHPHTSTLFHSHLAQDRSGVKGQRNKDTNNRSSRRYRERKKEQKINCQENEIEQEKINSVLTTKVECLQNLRDEMEAFRKYIFFEHMNNSLASGHPIPSPATDHLMYKSCMSPDAQCMEIPLAHQDTDFRHLLPSQVTWFKFVWPRD